MPDPTSYTWMPHTLNPSVPPERSDPCSPMNLTFEPEITQTLNLKLLLWSGPAAIRCDGVRRGPRNDFSEGDVPGVQGSEEGHPVWTHPAGQAGEWVGMVAVAGKSWATPSCLLTVVAAGSVWSRVPSSRSSCGTWRHALDTRAVHGYKRRRQYAISAYRQLFYSQYIFNTQAEQNQNIIRRYSTRSPYVA